MCEIIGFVTEIVSNQYHLLVLIRKVIALQRLFHFCHGVNPFCSFSMAEKGRRRVYEITVLYTYSLNNSGILSALRKKIDLKGKILKGLFGEKSYAILAKRGCTATFKSFQLA